jgi:hypothetical protein
MAGHLGHLAAFSSSRVAPLRIQSPVTRQGGVMPGAPVPGDSTSGLGVKPSSTATTTATTSTRKAPGAAGPLPANLQTTVVIRPLPPAQPGGPPRFMVQVVNGTLTREDVAAILRAGCAAEVRS